MLLDGWVVEFDLEIGISLSAIHSHKIKKNFSPFLHLKNPRFGPNGQHFLHGNSYLAFCLEIAKQLSYTKDRGGDKHGLLDVDLKTRKGDGVDRKSLNW
jgi:hypothetical protein